MFHVKPWRALCAITLGWAALLPAHAQQKLLPEQSEVVFVSRQMGVPVEGRFRRLAADVAFDPARPAASRIRFSVDVASATLGVRETDAELPKPTWFDAARFPQATFQSTAVRPLGGGRFEVAGQLSLKGVSSPVVLPVSLSQPSGPTGVTLATGQFPLKRLTFRIGDQEWSDTSMVADEVQVRFKLALTGVGKL